MLRKKSALRYNAPPVEPDSHNGDQAPIDLSIIVPALNEAQNLAPLAEAVAASVGTRAYEIIIVDDNSQDDTRIVCAKLSQAYPLKLLVRERPTNGLSGAVLHGIAQAGGKYLAVMDADLQHPPDRLPALLAPLESGEADFVIGSRYVAGGGTAEGWTLFRRLNSGVATLLARPFAGNATDPMSGFFALHRKTYEQGDRLTPLGYKIALELMCKCHVRRVHEIPIHFGLRTRGRSKLSLKQQFRYLEHLSRLYDFTFPRASPVVKFLIATSAGWLVGFLTYWLLLTRNIGCVVAVSTAYLACILVTLLFHLRYVHTQREFILRQMPWADFAVISIAEWGVCALTAYWIEHRVLDLGNLERFVISFAAATLVRYILRKEFMQDIRGLRKDVRALELG